MRRTSCDMNAVGNQTPNRRDFMTVGLLGGAGLSLSLYQRLDAAGALDSGGARAGILVFLRGGPSHIDTFDPKPESPREYRGEFATIPTKVPGLVLCEHLPRLAQCADKFSVLRGVSHTFAAHSLGSEYLNTGSRPLSSLEYPSFGAAVLKERPPEHGVPGYVAAPEALHGPGFLGKQYSAFCTGNLPLPGKAGNVRGVSLPSTLPLAEFDRRHRLLQQLDRRFASLEGRDPAVNAIDEFNSQTHAMISSPRTREAFDLSKESPGFAARFGTDEWGGASLLAIRLVEAGVRFVTLCFSGWDTHANNFPSLKNQLLPKLDRALSGLFTGLEDRGLLGTTAVMVTGEFGRTPKINGNASPGRDHYPKCMSVLMAGGRIRGGLVIGESDATGSEPAETAYSPEDVAATFYANLGLDPSKVYQSPSGRPITLVRDGSALHELFG
jgi:hypothetical protein